MCVGAARFDLGFCLVHQQNNVNLGFSTRSKAMLIFFLLVSQEMKNPSEEKEADIDTGEPRHGLGWLLL